MPETDTPVLDLLGKMAEIQPSTATSIRGRS